MNEAETRAEHIDPALKAAGWGVVEGSRIRREYPITLGRLEGHGRRGKALTADYVLEYRNTKLAVVEAKAWNEKLSEGVAQAKNYAGMLAVRFTYSTNGRGIYQVDMSPPSHSSHPAEGEVSRYPTPEELWKLRFPSTASTGSATGEERAARELVERWRDRFAVVPFEDKGGFFSGRYYQDTAVERVLAAIAGGRQRILLTLATGTGKTFIAFQIAWKLFHARWNLSSTGSDTGYVARRPRILFLADRNILADQAYNAFSAFPEDAMVRIAPDDIKKKGKVPTNGSLFFTIFQTFMASTGSATDNSTGSATDNSTGSATDNPTGSATEDAETGPTEFKEVTVIREAYGYMYILECADGSLYVGSTRNLQLRIEQHNLGEGSKHTAARRPVKLVYYECFERIDEAFAREKQVQGWSRAKKIALVKGDTDLLKRLSRASTNSASAVPEPVEGYFGEYPPDFFDFIVIDECHRGGANDESTWRDILTYFKPAVQLGLTATPKRDDNVDTYKYFGEPVFIYSLKQGINDGYLTPFKVKQISTTLDDYIYTHDDDVVAGQVEEGKRYEEKDFNRVIEIPAREKKRVDIFMNQIDQREKTLVFCASQDHALAVRDYINRIKTSKDPNYCQRVTANDGALGEQHLRDFQDNEKNSPVILTTSQKLSTGVDARNIRNIVLMRPIGSMIEFKQIIGRGTRLYDGKDYFTIYDFVQAHHHFSDPEWDGEPIEPEPKEPPRVPRPPPLPPHPPLPPREKIKIKLAPGKELTIQHMMATTFWRADGRPMSAAEFLQSLYGKLPEFFKDETELRQLWSEPGTRKALLDGLAAKGYGHGPLVEIQRAIDLEKSDLFDVLALLAFQLKPVTREQRAENAKLEISTHFNSRQRVFLEFVLAQYVKVGVDELAAEKLSPLLKLKYNNAIADAIADLGKPEEIGKVFASFQKYLYDEDVA